MDYSKFKYDQEKKERRIKKKQHVSQLKQIRIKPRIGDGDYQIKLRQAEVFLNKRDKVKINLMFRGREMMHKDLGRKVLEKMIVDLDGVGVPDKAPSFEGRTMYILFNPLSDKTPSSKKKSEPKKQEQK
ncbi:MAG: translation initiation factor IF-3 [Lysobacterales bacterium]|jgi:translation initiation factor IF-3